MDADAFERQLYLCRREIEHRTKEIHGFYMPSFSNRLISYKALAMPAALRAFYLDFSDPDYEVASDSASLDHALELLILSGRSPEHARCMLVPPAYRNDEDISDELRAF
jgi:glutamate synthase domain-containing protein 1